MSDIALGVFVVSLLVVIGTVVLTDPGPVTEAVVGWAAVVALVAFIVAVVALGSEQTGGWE